MKITPKKYAQALADILEGTQSDAPQVIHQFLSVLSRRKQFKLLPKIVMAFEKEWCLRKGIVQMNVTYPKKFESALVEFEASLNTKMGKTIQMKKTASETILGGYRIKMDDVLLDASIETKLNSLASHFNN